MILPLWPLYIQCTKWCIYISTAVPPSFTKVPKTVISFVSGATATIECGVFGLPKPTVQWSRALLSLPQGRSQQQDGRLTISGIQLQDSGTYICKASNKLGTIRTVSTLAVQGKKLYISWHFRYYGIVWYKPKQSAEGPILEPRRILWDIGQMLPNHKLYIINNLTIIHLLFKMC